MGTQDTQQVTVGIPLSGKIYSHDYEIVDLKHLRVDRLVSFIKDFELATLDLAELEDLGYSGFVDAITMLFTDSLGAHIYGVYVDGQPFAVFGEAAGSYVLLTSVHVKRLPKVFIRLFRKLKDQLKEADHVIIPEYHEQGQKMARLAGLEVVGTITEEVGLKWINYRRL